MAEACAKIGIDTATLWTELGYPSNLWNAKCFPVAASPMEATTRALAMAMAVLGTGSAVDPSWLAGATSLDTGLKLSNAGTQGGIRRDIVAAVVKQRAAVSFLHQNGTKVTTTSKMVTNSPNVSCRY